MSEIEICQMQIIQKEKLHRFDQINYSKFSSIYQNSQELLLNYGIQLSQKEFAIQILQLTPLQLKSMKYAKGSPKILKNYEVSNEEITRIRKKMIATEKLHRNAMLTYDELKNLFNNSNYFLPLSENEYFEKVLDIQYLTLRGLYLRKLETSKSENQKQPSTRILGNEQVDENEILAFRAYVMKDANLHSGDSLTYTQCRAIFEKYFIRLSEEDFMQQILDVSLKSYNEARYNNEKTVWILRNEHPSFESIQELKKLIIVSEKLHRDDKLKYHQIVDIFNKYYTPLSLHTFAQQIFEVSEKNLNSAKSRGDNVVILKNMEFTPETIAKFRSELIPKARLYIGQKINYKQFLKIYNEYFFPLSEKDYAEQILEISSKNFDYMKCYPTKRFRILKNETISFDEIKILQEKILKEYKIGQLINIDIFNQIYKKFPFKLSKSDYAEKVLGITKSKYKDMKAKKTKSSIQCGKSEYENKIFTSLQNNGYYLGYKIDLEEFKTLYETFGNKATLQTFASTIGVDYAILVKKLKQPILNKRLKKAKDEFKQSIKNKPVSFHTIEEMQEFCSNNNISFEEFQKYILSIYFHNTDSLKKLIEKQNGCWYGNKKIPCSPDFSEKYANRIFNLAQSIAQSLCRKYRLHTLTEEYTSEAVLYIIEKCGDLEKNYEDSEKDLFDRISQRTRLALKGMLIASNFRIKIISTTKYYINSEDDLEIADKNINIENEVLDSLTNPSQIKSDNTEKLIETILSKVAQGYDVDDTLEDLSIQLDCNKNNLMLKIREYYIKSKKIPEK